MMSNWIYKEPVALGEMLPSDGKTNLVDRDDLA